MWYLNGSNGNLNLNFLSEQLFEYMKNYLQPNIKSTGQSQNSYSLSTDI